MLLLVVHDDVDGMAKASVVYEKDMAVTAYAAVEGEDKECDGGEIPMLAQHDILRRCVHPCYRAISHGTC